MRKFFEVAFEMMLIVIITSAVLFYIYFVFIQALNMIDSADNRLLAFIAIVSLPCVSFYFGKLCRIKKKQRKVNETVHRKF